MQITICEAVLSRVVRMPMSRLMQVRTALSYRLVKILSNFILKIMQIFYLLYLCIFIHLLNVKPIYPDFPSEIALMHYLHIL